MPYLHLTAGVRFSAIRQRLPRYLERAGINLCTTARGDALHLHLQVREESDALMVYHTGTNVQYAQFLMREFGRLCLQNGVKRHLCCGSSAQVVCVFSPIDLRDTDAISRAIAAATEKFFCLQELPPQPELPARLDASGTAALRSFPSHASQMHHRIAPNAEISILGQSGNWMLIRHREIVGFIPSNRVRIWDGDYPSQSAKAE